MGCYLTLLNVGVEDERGGEGMRGELLMSAFAVAFSGVVWARVDGGDGGGKGWMGGKS